MTDARSFALVLTGPVGAGAVDAEAVAAARRALSNHMIIGDRALSAGDAHEILFVGDVSIDFVARRHAVAAALAGRPIDVNVVADDIAWRKRKLLVADMDSTIIQQECIDEIADVLGIKEKISAITERAMRGELQFEAALTERLALLAGVGEADLVRVWETRIALMPGARTLIATMKKSGAFTALVSGGFTFFTARVAEAVGFDVNHANVLGLEAGRMTGRVVGPILGKEAKLSTLEMYRTQRGLHAPETLAIGDGANDLAMIKAAGLGVAYRAKPVVAAEAAASITHGDLTAILYLQGYHREEFQS
jgi:phosphoserine phosphatase